MKFFRILQSLELTLFRFALVLVVVQFSRSLLPLVGSFVIISHLPPLVNTFFQSFLSFFGFTSFRNRCEFPFLICLSRRAIIIVVQAGMIRRLPNQAAAYPNILYADRPFKTYRRNSYADNSRSFSEASKLKIPFFFSSFRKRY